VSIKVSFRKSFFRPLTAITVVLCFTPSIKLAYGADLGAGPTVSISTDNSNQQTFDQANVTLTIDNGATVTRTGNQAIKAGVNSTIIVNSGGTINATGNQVINAFNKDTTIITNSGTLVADANIAIKVSGTTNAIITNNVGGLIIADTNTILGNGSSGLTITNSGTISVEDLSSYAIDLGSGTGATVTLQNGSLVIGTIRTSGSGTTIINSGSIENTDNPGNTAIDIQSNDNTVTLNETGKVIGLIEFAAGTTGNKLQLNQGFGRSYFYATSGTGDYTVEDLSGNTAVKGSAGSVGQGANETVDELLGLRSYNLRSALKRYSAFPTQFGKKEPYAEPFSYYSERGTSTSVLGYDIYGYGLNIIYPLLSNQLDLILTVEKSELELQEDHDISNTNVLAGVSAADFINLGPLKIGGFFVAGMGVHEGTRSIFTNTTTTGLLDVTSDYTSYEGITGTHASYSYKASPESKNIWTTEVGLTLGYSWIGAYSESEYFSWKKRNLVQGSIHIGERLTSKINDKLTVTVEGEVEHSNGLAGRKQSYAINGIPTESKDEQFGQTTVSGRLGATMDNNMTAHVNLDSRLSNYAKSRGTYGVNVGLSLAF